MESTAPFRNESSVLVPTPAMAYLRLVSRESGMLRRIVSNFYCRLPVIRELQAVVREHQKVTALLLHVENYVPRFSPFSRLGRILDRWRQRFRGSFGKQGRPPAGVILDDATSVLDMATEAKLLEAIG